MMHGCSCFTAATISSRAIGLRPLKRGVRDQAQRFEACLKSFARHAFGRVGTTQIRYAAFVLAEVPIAAVKTHLQHREPPPPLVDELITKTYHAIVGGKGATIPA